MIGTAIEKQALGLIASAARPRVGRYALLGMRRAPSWRGRLADVWSDGRKLLIAILSLSFLLGIVICGPAAHQALEPSSPIGIQAVERVAQSAPVEHGAPIKSKLPGLCTGHCVAHSLTLPAQFLQAVVPFARRTVWLVVDDQWSQASRPERLERPPRG